MGFRTKNITSDKEGHFDVMKRFNLFNLKPHNSKRIGTSQS